jgi:hypothetical protein
MKLLIICVALGLLRLAGASLASQCWTSAQVAAPDSIEGQLRSEGMCWTRTHSEICVGAYVQDILEGRLDQPEGRGAVGQVAFISTGGNGEPAATVDFGRGYSVGIYFSEICPVIIAPEVREQPEPLGIDFPGGWTSAEVAAPDSIEGQLRSEGTCWIWSRGEICVGGYVQDILEGRLDQPVGRGAIGHVISTSTAEDGEPLAMVDFGRGYSVGIYFSELCPVIIAPGP